MKKYSKKRRRAQDDADLLHSNNDADGSMYEIAVKKIKEAYKFVERRQVTVKTADDLPQLGGIYSAQMLKITKNFQPKCQEFLDTENEHNNDNRKRLLTLPSDGSIFHNGIPFHHFALTPLEPKHILRLKQNGVEIKKAYFSSQENEQILENWRSFSSAHKISDDEAPLYMSAATANETSDDHKDRLRFIHSTLFRPWMCARLLNRTAYQVFRRCYHLFRVSLAEIRDTREWTAEDNERLLKLVKLHGTSWEFIGNELLRPRYSCYRRYRVSTGINKPFENEGAETSSQQEYTDAENYAEYDQWSNVEIARLYNHLSDSLPRNPVLIAILPKYANFDEHLDWSSSKFRLPLKSATARKQKWEELKNQFRAAKERLQCENIKQILREVIPEDTTILAKAKRFRRRKKYVSPLELGEDVILLKEYCSEHLIEKLRDVNVVELEEKLKSNGELKYEIKHFLGRMKYMLFCAYKIKLFKMLPIEQDTLEVHLELLAFILKKIESYRVKKKILRKYTRRFLKSKGWKQRENIVYVMKKEPKNLKWESTVEKIDILQNRV